MSELPAMVLERHRERTPDRRLVVLIDGGSGSGKTSLARALTDDLRAELGEPVQLVSLDDCYPGWSGLAAGAAMIPAMLDSRDPHHPTWDWERNQTSGRIDLDPDAPTIIEGCGSLTPTNRALATVTLWCDLAATTRKERALTRDGDGFRPWWTHWEQQELTHWRTHRPRSLADVIADQSHTPAVITLRP